MKLVPSHRRLVERACIGWREWIALPGLGVTAIKTKVDTGARSSALHVSGIEHFRKGRKPWVRFLIHPIQRDSSIVTVSEAELLDLREIKSSSGHKQERAVVLTDVQFMGETWPIEITLAHRDLMGFRMLLGREAIRGRFVVDPAVSYLGDKPKLKRKKTR